MGVCAEHANFSRSPKKPDFMFVFTKIKQWAILIANIGVTKDLDSQEKNKTQVLNIAVAAGIPGYLYFITINFLHHKPILAVVNILLLLGSSLILYINSIQKFVLGRLILSFLGSLLFCIGGIFFRNGAENSLLASIIVVIIFFNERRLVILLTIVNCFLFLAIKIILLGPVIFDTVPNSRVIFNTAWALAIIVISLLYIKRQQTAYQKQIERNNWELEAMNSSREKLFSIIAHDLRSPIGQLKTLLDLVNEQHISVDTFKQLTATISQEVDQLHTTMDSLLKWSISQSQGIHAVPERIVLSGVIEEAMVFFRQKAEQKQIRLLADDAGLSVYADRDHLQIILRNLVSNAFKYSHVGGIILIRSYAKEADVIIQVIDQGTGMTEDLVNTVLSDSNIVSHSGTANERGTGLGLKLCKEFVEGNKGKIWVESEVDKGSTFSVALPSALDDSP